MAKITPLGDRVVVESDKKAEETTTSSGFIVASKEKNDRPKSGKIIAIGPDVKDIAIGDMIIFKEFIPTEFKHEDNEYLILSQDDILAKIV
jgi:chaperonin GroES